MKIKHHISQSSYQMLLDYLAKFLILDDQNYYHHLEQSLIGWSCGGRDEEMHKAGTVLKKSWFITKGMVYLYFIDKKAREKWSLCYSVPERLPIYLTVLQMEILQAVILWPVAKPNFWRFPNGI
ncbi:hypothetical protein [Pedobacter sp. NJ-S-72]